MASGELYFAGGSDYELIETKTWLGTTLQLWRNGHMMTLTWGGNMNTTSTAGAKNQYITIPEAYRPPYNVWSICFDQNGKRFILQASSSGNAGIYYQLDAVSSGTGCYGFISWATK